MMKVSTETEKPSWESRESSSKPKAFKKKVENDQPRQELPSLFSPQLLLQESSDVEEIAMISPAALNHLCESIESISLSLVEKNEITIIETSYHMEDSPFDGLLIHIDHYAIAPDSFHIELSGTPEAVSLLDARLSDLLFRLQCTIPQTHFHLSTGLIKDEIKTASVLDTREKKRQKVVHTSGSDAH